MAETLRGTNADKGTRAAGRPHTPRLSEQRRHGALAAARGVPPHPTAGAAEPTGGGAAMRAGLRRLHDGMIGAILGGEGLARVAALAAEALGAPVLIVIPELIETVLATAGVVDDEALARLEAWAAERACGRPTIVRDELVVETPVTLGDRTIGVVGVGLLGSALDADAHWVLDAAAVAAATAIALDEARLETEHAIRGSFLEQLRSGEQLSREEIVRRARRLGCDLSSGATVLCVELASNRPRMVAAAIAEAFPGAFAEPVGRSDDERAEVWALLPAAVGRPGGEPRAPDAVAEAGKRLAARMRQYGNVGISRFHRDPAELARAIDEARLMLEVARRVASPSGDEIVDGTYKLLFRLLASHPDELRSYHDTTIAPLVRHDHQYRTDLVRTLETYLDTNCNMNTTAELIFAHRHTVAHRLDRIRELTGLDATVHEDREQLGLGLKIHRLTA